MCSRTAETGRPYESGLPICRVQWENNSIQRTVRFANDMPRQCLLAFIPIIPRRRHEYSTHNLPRVLLKDTRPKVLCRHGPHEEKEDTAHDKPCEVHKSLTRPHPPPHSHASHPEIQLSSQSFRCHVATNCACSMACI